MVVSSLRVAAYFCGALVLPAAAGAAPLIAAAAPQADFTPLRADGNGAAALRRVARANIDRRPLGAMLDSLAQDAGLGLTYGEGLAGLARPVSLRAEQLSVADALLRLVSGSGVELLVSATGQTLVARRAPDAGALSGVVRDRASGEPVSDAELEVEGMRARAASRADGRFRIAPLPAGTYALSVRRIGYRPVRVSGVVIGDSGATLAIVLERAATPLADVVVTPGYYGVMEQRLAAPQTMSREEIRTVPQVGEDLFRTVNRLPGVSASDFSAAFRVRSGSNDELYATLDGLQLYEPFHLKDFDGGLSIIDVAAIGGLDLTTGGFGAQYGDRLTGVLEMRTVSPPPDSVRTELAVTLTTVRATSAGAVAGGRGGWLASARRGFLEYALKAAGEEDDLHPRYYDALGKVWYRPGASHEVSFHVLHAGDRLSYVDDPGDPRLTSFYASSYAWAAWDAALWPRLRARTVLSAGRLTWRRHGERESLYDRERDLLVDDERRFDVAGARQDWSFEQSDRALLKWGVDVKRLTADYDYFRAERRLLSDAGELVARADTARALVAPRGTALGAYAAQRARPWAPLTAEVGLRYDRQSYSDDSHVSPRASAAYALGDRTTLRGAWGRYWQAQGIHQLQVQDGVTGFARAELAEHRVLGIERRFARGMTARLEGYERRLLRLRPRFTSVDNSIDVFPEIEPDRRLVAPSSGSARGVELFVKREAAARVAWSVSYAWARAEDRVGGRLVPRTLDQRHTVALDLAYRPSPTWRLSAAWLYHSGWPTTRFTFALDTLADGRILVSRVYGERNAERLAPYHRLDVRATKRFEFAHSRLSAFVDVFNVYNRRNARAQDQFVAVQGSRVTVGSSLDAQLPRLPSFGLAWEF